MTLRWYGEEVMARIDAGGERGIDEGLRVIGRESQRQVPVQTGELRDSYKKRTQGLQGVVGYTDSKAAAAHENLTARHAPGKRSKFLEAAAQDNRAAIRDAVADEIRRAL